MASAGVFARLGFMVTCTGMLSYAHLEGNYLSIALHQHDLARYIAY